MSKYFTYFGRSKIEGLLFQQDEPVNIATIHDVAEQLCKDPCLASICSAPLMLQDGEEAHQFILTFEDPYTLNKTLTRIAYIIDPIGQKATFLEFEPSFYSCIKPEKIVFECDQCMRNLKGSNPCYWKQQVNALTPYANGGIGLYQAITPHLLEMGKSKILDFGYVSPSMTKPRVDHHSAFVPTLRPMEDHDFTELEFWKDVRKQQRQERTRRDIHIKTKCNQCIVKTGCFRGNKPRQRVAYCRGNYSEESIADLNSRIVHPYTAAEVVKLLCRSGPLTKRYQGKKWYATWAINEPNLIFGLTRMTNPKEFESLSTHMSIAEIHTFLDKHGTRQTHKEFNFPHLKWDPTAWALFYSSIALYDSPTYQGAWRTRPYPVTYISPNNWDEEHPQFLVHFSWNSWHSSGGWQLPWSLDITKLDDIQEHYNGLRLLKRS
jgi:hypothetical protein